MTEGEKIIADGLHPGVTTPAICGEEPHGDPGGEAVAWGITHRATSAADCCAKCTAHAKLNPKKPCNSWSFCYLPVCWGLDNAHNHTFGECWLKYQPNLAAVIWGQRGQYTAEYREKHKRVGVQWHYPRPPSHVPWTGGVIGAVLDPSIVWTTGVEGMRSSKGDELTNWRAWEAPGEYEKRLARRRANATQG